MEYLRISNVSRHESQRFLFWTDLDDVFDKDFVEDDDEWDEDAEERDDGEVDLPFVDTTFGTTGDIPSETVEGYVIISDGLGVNGFMTACCLLPEDIMMMLPLIEPLPVNSAILLELLLLLLISFDVMICLK